MSDVVVDKAWCAWRALLLRHAAWRGREGHKVHALANDEAVDLPDLKRVTLLVWHNMRTMVFRLIFLRDIHYSFTIGVGIVCLIFQFLCEPWPYNG